MGDALDAEVQVVGERERQTREETACNRPTNASVRL
jgi:hypothetical protein